MVAAAGPEAAQVVLANKDKAYSQQGWTYFIGPFFNRGPDAAGLRRAPLPPPAHAAGVHQPTGCAAYLGRVGDVARRGLSGWQPDERFTVYPALKRLTLDIATEIFMASELGRPTPAG